LTKYDNKMHLLNRTSNSNDDDYIKIGFEWIIIGSYILLLDDNRFWFGINIEWNAKGVISISMNF
jgi:hypothetical protein